MSERRVAKHRWRGIPLRPDPGVCGLWLANARWFEDDNVEVRCVLEARHLGEHKGESFEPFPSPSWFVLSPDERYKTWQARHRPRAMSR